MEERDAQTGKMMSEREDTVINQSIKYVVDRGHAAEKNRLTSCLSDMTERGSVLRDWLRRASRFSANAVTAARGLNGPLARSPEGGTLSPLPPA
ncbi:hypothetical protein SKAU_G00110730 [Synaphobranchus kaupii]|uniref:Uncharacterized protein n=1 Tax=Synaphobranchus kaupii TaxID=118154 RepID=A0A9Q1G0D0_SYNKA|nr:hypothetical protein SKAU_G00110730 [Synaphobranchus kaupii]